MQSQHEARRRARLESNQTRRRAHNLAQLLHCLGTQPLHVSRLADIAGNSHHLAPGELLLVREKGEEGGGAGLGWWLGMQQSAVVVQQRHRLAPTSRSFAAASSTAAAERELMTTSSPRLRNWRARW